MFIDCPPCSGMWTTQDRLINVSVFSIMYFWKGPERSLEQLESMHERGLELVCVWVFCGSGGGKNQHHCPHMQAGL